MATLFNQANPTGAAGYATTSTNDATYGVMFTVASSSSLTGIWFYSPSGATFLPTAVNLYTYGGGAAIASNLSPSWSGAAGSGWVRTSFPSTALSPGTTYVADYVIGSNSTLVGYIFPGSSPGAWFPATSGDGNVTAPSTVSGNHNGPYQNSSAGYPGTWNANNLNWLIDVEVTPSGVYNPLRDNYFGANPTVANDVSSYTFGYLFKATQNCQINGVWWYCDVANTQYQNQMADEKIALWTVTGVIGVGGATTYVSGSLTTAGTYSQGWNLIPFSSPISLTAGTEYMVVKGISSQGAGGLGYSYNYCGNGTSSSFFLSGGPGANGYSEGPGLVYSSGQAGETGSSNLEPYGNGQQTFHAGGSNTSAPDPSQSANLPGSCFHGGWYGMDVQLQTTVSGITGSGGVKLPALKLSGGGAPVITGSGGVKLPALKLAGTGKPGITGAGGVKLPSLKLAGGAPTVITGSGGVKLPALLLAGLGKPGITGSGGVRLPSMRLSGGQGVPISAVQWIAWDVLTSVDAEAEVAWNVGNGVQSNMSQMASVPWISTYPS